ncbi:vWA domain-containing protein [Phycicoccus sonneratiae]|uniref:von Willebrand factor type A domain-containing protein n=1 Tax=Phycicoccus sonneratiae TaxID=2807628 RepID=A0ABS2CP76_9MICO|nr:von Willebrand factor type A domain-containing protein [Phycicoccus sonneraticus]MBM6401233.1 von Willebrand factor type A domain-containing protein [Phycicoccus sonneraticus]
MTMHHRSRTAWAAAALATTILAAGCSAGSHDGNGSSAGEYQPGPNGAAPNGQRDTNDNGGDRGYTPNRHQALTDPSEDAQSTFALDIDTGSYTRFRDAVRNGTSLPRNEIRTEEFVNYFEQDYDAPRDGLGVSIDAATLPFAPGHRLVRVGIRSADVADRDRLDANLVLVVDCSGSMDEAGKMETTKAALRTLAANLRPTDTVAMVCYSTEADLLLEPTPASDRQALEDAIHELSPQASTNAAAGLSLGYDVAARMRADSENEHRMTRVVLVSDGVANVGPTSTGGILERIGTETRNGINLVSVGVGIADYDDELLEQLADRGDGWHVYVDTEAEAERVFATGLTNSLVLTAKDAKAQVEFDPELVAGYRLVGYENRAVADDDFRDDSVDGGEVFAGHATTALYDVELREGSGRGKFVSATVRYQEASGEAVERRAALTGDDCVTDLDEASPRLQQDLVVAMLTDHLTDGPWSERVDPSTLREAARSLPDRLDGDRDVAELVDLVERTTA